MSQVFKDYGTKYYIYAGTKKGFTTVIIDPSTNKAADLTNSVLYNSGFVDICKSDGTVIQSVSIDFTNRNVNTSYVTWIITPFDNTQAGNWVAYLKIKNSNGDIIDQQIFNFVIYESY